MLSPFIDDLGSSLLFLLFPLLQLLPACGTLCTLHPKFSSPPYLSIRLTFSLSDLSVSQFPSIFRAFYSWGGIFCLSWGDMILRYGLYSHGRATYLPLFSLSTSFLYDFIVEKCFPGPLIVWYEAFYSSSGTTKYPWNYQLWIIKSTTNFFFQWYYRIQN